MQGSGQADRGRECTSPAPSQEDDEEKSFLTAQKLQSAVVSTVSVSHLLLFLLPNCVPSGQKIRKRPSSEPYAFQSCSFSNAKRRLELIGVL